MKNHLGTPGNLTIVNNQEKIDGIVAPEYRTKHRFAQL